MICRLRQERAIDDDVLATTVVVCLFDTIVGNIGQSCKTAVPIEMPFRSGLRWAQKVCVRLGKGADPPWEGVLWVHTWACRALATPTVVILNKAMRSLSVSIVPTCYDLLTMQHKFVIRPFREEFFFQNNSSINIVE